MNKPLARWTIGPVSKIGMDILKESVRRFEKIYPEFDRVVCYNHIDPPQITEAKLFLQSQDQIEYPLSAAEENPEELDGRPGMIGSGWKLCPPRLNMESHELWIDNDIIIWDRIPEIDDWIKSDHSIISEGLYGVYGVFEEDVPNDIKACAGLFGLPPNFNFSNEIKRRCEEKLAGEPLGHYDEQGLVAATVTNSKHVIMPFSSITIVHTDEELPEEWPPAFHFVGSNRTKQHQGWCEYQSIMRKIIL